MGEYASCSKVNIRDVVRAIDHLVEAYIQNK